MQCFEAEVNARGNRATDIGTIAVNHIKGGGCPKIDDDKVATKQIMPSDGIDQPIRSNGCARIDAHRNRKPAIGASHHQRPRAEILIRQNPQVKHNPRNRRRNHHLINIAGDTI